MITWYFLPFAFVANRRDLDQIIKEITEPYLPQVSDPGLNDDGILLSFAVVVCWGFTGEIGLTDITSPAQYLPPCKPRLHEISCKHLSTPLCF